jgi:deoxyribodipyrimidine photolyase-related protein
MRPDPRPGFGPYQDAMLSGEWAMNHALLSSSLNLGLLRPGEVIAAGLDPTGTAEERRQA